MHILIYGLNYAPELTGTGKYTGEMVAWLAARGHQVEVICGLPHYPAWRVEPRYRGFLFRSETLDGVTVHRVRHYVPGVDRLNTRARILLETSFSLSAARYWLPRFFSGRKPQVVVVVTPPMQAGVWPFLYSRLRGVPWVLHVQDLQVDAALRLGMLKSGGAGRVLYGFESYLLRRATRVSTITEAMRQRVLDKGADPERVWLLPNWSDIQAVRPGARENAFRAELGLAPEDIVVLYAGNMGEKQGLEVVLGAAAQLSREPGIRFVLAGDGATRPRLEETARKMELANVIFVPVQPASRLAEMLAVGDIHLVVQRREAADLVMPSKLTNILAAGRACVATADPGTTLHEVVAGYETGLVTPPEDPAALASAVRELAYDEQRRKRYGRHARAYAEAHLDREQILARFEEQLTSLSKEQTA